MTEQTDNFKFKCCKNRLGAEAVVAAIAVPNIRHVGYFIREENIRILTYFQFESTEQRK